MSEITKYDELIQKYPDLFSKEKNTVIGAWGIEAPEGWYNIINNLVSGIDFYLSQYPDVPKVVILQVKEKFGDLRFYYQGGDDRIRGMVTMASSMSTVTCNVCGDVGERRQGGWVRTLCDKHQAERLEREAKREAEMSAPSFPQVITE